MKKITLFFVALLVSSMCFSQLTVTKLWDFSVTNANATAVVDDVKNGIAISPDGTKLYLSTRTADASQVAIYNPATGVRTGYLPALAGFVSNYGGDVAVDGNGAIYASNVIISASDLKIVKWDNATATPTLFISTTAHTGSGTNRIGYGMDVRVNSAGNGFIIMHKNGTSDFLIWTITANVPTSQNPTIITAGTVITDSYARISIIDDNKFWVDGNIAKPWLATITKSGPEINATPTAIALEAMVNGSVGVAPGGMTEFMLSGNRYGVIAANNHGATYPEGHIARLQKLAATGAGVEVDVIATLPTAGLGKTTDASHFVESVVHVNGLDAYIYTMGGFNGITAHKVTAPTPAPPSKKFTVKVPNGTEKVYIAGTFTGKVWDIANPYELTATANANEFTGTFECEEGVEYKYFCEKDWDFGEAVYNEGNDPNPRGNRTYNAADEVPIWFRVNKITLNASFVTGTAPSVLYVKGSFDGWAAGVLMTKTGDTFSHVLGGNPGDKLPANTQYKYYTTEMGLNTLDHAENWETEADGAGKSNRWSINPIMNDEVKRFESRSFGVFKVGTTTGADFASLKAATTAVNAATIKGNIVLEITSDLTEAADISLGVNTDIYKITIKPAETVSPTITFTNTGASISIDGHFVIGSPTANTANLISTNNIIIDGSNTVNGTTKDMTFIGSASSIARSVFRVFGNNDGITIKNCIITTKNTSSSSNAPIQLTNYTTLAPDNFTALNNTLNGNSGNGSLGAFISVSGTPTALMTGIKIQNNIVTSRATRAIMFNYVADGEISGNTISHDLQLSAGAAQTIAVLTGGATEGTYNIFNNKIMMVKTWNTAVGPSASNGAIGIDNQLAAPKIVNIYNNFITGFTIASASVQGVKIYGIRHIGGSTSNVYQNTIVIPEMTDMTTSAGSFIAGIAFATAATVELAPNGIMNVKNNIIVSNETGMKTWGIRRVGTGGTFTSDNNILYSASTSNGFIGYYSNIDAKDLNAWQTAALQDANSKSVNVNFVDAAAGDLRIGGLSIQAGELAVPLLASVTTDMFGTVRTGSDRGLTYAGAHESVTPFIFTSTTNVESTARIMRTTTGVQVELDGEANIELYNMSGMLLDKVRANGTYSRNLDNGIYIIRINGKATKFIK